MEKCSHVRQKYGDGQTYNLCCDCGEKVMTKKYAISEVMSKKQALIASVNPDLSKRNLIEFKKAMSMLKTVRHSVGLYSKLRVTFAVLGVTKNKKVFAFLTKGKYDFSKGETKISGMYAYAVNADSIEKAYAFKMKLKKAIKGY